MVTAAETEGIRPQLLDHFIGQEQVRKNLRVYIKAALARGQPLDHVLLAGPPGLGKTSLAHIIARELNADFRQTAGPVLSRPGDLAGMLMNLAPNSVFFIDEIHRMPVMVEEILYSALEDGRVDIKIGQGNAVQSLSVGLPPFTLIGATTRDGSLSQPLFDRFGIIEKVHFYHQAALVSILTRAATGSDTVCSAEALEEIARRSRGTPRVALRLLRRVLDFAIADGSAVVSPGLAAAALQQMQIDNLGLTEQDREYLNRLAASDQAVGVETLAAGMGLETDVIKFTIEPFLLRMGLVNKTPNGRVLSPQGRQSLGAEPAGSLFSQS